MWLKVTEYVNNSMCRYKPCEQSRSVLKATVSLLPLLSSSLALSPLVSLWELSAPSASAPSIHIHIIKNNYYSLKLTIFISWHKRRSPLDTKRQELTGVGCHGNFAWRRQRFESELTPTSQRHFPDPELAHVASVTCQHNNSCQCYYFTHNTIFTHKSMYKLD